MEWGGRGFSEVCGVLYGELEPGSSWRFAREEHGIVSGRQLRARFASRRSWTATPIAPLRCARSIDAWLPESDTLQVIELRIGMGESALYWRARAHAQVYDSRGASGRYQGMVMVRVEIGIVGRLALALASPTDKRAATCAPRASTRGRSARNRFSSPANSAACSKRASSTPKVAPSARAPRPVRDGSTPAAPSSTPPRRAGDSASCRVATGRAARGASRRLVARAKRARASAARGHSGPRFSHRRLRARPKRAQARAPGARACDRAHGAER